MDDADRARFALSMNNLASVFNAEMGDIRLYAYWQALKYLPIENVREGIERATKECKFMPPPAVLRDLAPEVRAVPEWLMLPPIDKRPPPPEVPTVGEMADGTAGVVRLARERVDGTREKIKNLEPSKARSELVILLSRYIGELDSAVKNHEWAKAEAEKHGKDYRPPLRGSAYVAPPPRKHWSETER